MPRAPALTPDQDRLLRQRVRAGADLPALITFAQKHKITVSKTTLGALLKSEREHPTAPAAPEKPTLEGLAVRVAALEGQLAGLGLAPGLKLSEVLNNAVEVARRLLSRPDIDPAGASKIMAQLPDLAEAARKALETEMSSGDEDLGI